MKNLLLTAIILLAAVLRLYALDKYPFGLNADEAAIGYNAYSLLTTGHDEHGASWPLVFRSFDDYKPPLYFYLVLPFVKVLGLNIWSVRLPSALLGTLSVYLVYLLAISIFTKQTMNHLACRQAGVQGDKSRHSGLDPESAFFNPGLLAALMLAISPWHLHFSRGGWEVNAATTFLLLGLVLFFEALKKPKYFIFCSLALVASLYTYHSMRIIIPILGLSLLLLYFPTLKSSGKYIVISLIAGFILLLPLAGQMLSPSGQSRFTGVSVFADSGPLWEALELRHDHPGPLAVAFHNRYVAYSLRFAKNYFSHYSPRFLFITGDEIARSHVPGMGQLLLVTLPFFYLGLFELFGKPTRSQFFLLFWLIVAPLAAALTFQSPHALRAQNMSIPLSIITAYGLYELINKLQKNKPSPAKERARVRFIPLIVFVLITMCFLYDFSRYLHQYYVHYPNESPVAWQGGFEDLLSYINPIQNQYDQIIISDTYDQPYIITAFFLKYPPDKFQKEIVLEPRDKFGFSTVRHFGNFSFRHIEGEDFAKPRTLVVTTTESAPPGATLKKTITGPGTQVLFSVWDTLQ